jgi:hypothetical protein
MTTPTEKPGIERWIEAAAKAAYETNINMIGDFAPVQWADLIEDTKDEYRQSAQVAVRVFLQAAQDDGVKLTPRAMTSAMADAYRGTAIDPEAECRPVFDVGPDYPDE